MPEEHLLLNGQARAEEHGSKGSQGSKGRMQGEMLERARALVPLIAGAASEIEASGQVTAGVMAALHDAQMFRMLLPRSYGGLELSLPEFIEVVEVIAGADASTAWCVGQGCGCSFASAWFEPAAAREIFARPDAVLAWGPSTRNARATATDGGYVISGQWLFASGSRNASWLAGHCPVHEADGTPRLGPDGRQVERSLLFAKDKAAITDVWQVMGLRGTGSDNYAVENLFVPERFGFTRDHAPDLREQGTLYRFSFLNIYGAAFAAVALGIARAMLESFYELAAVKTPNHASAPLADSSAVQREAGYNEAKLQAARAYLLRSFEQAWEEVDRSGACSDALKITLRMCSTWTIQAAREVAAFAWQSAGSTAVFQSAAFERRFRDMHCVTQQGQSHFTNFEPAGKMLMGRGTAPRRG